jgi:hypothetical protein
MNKEDYRENRLKYLKRLINRRKYLEDKILHATAKKTIRFYSTERNALTYAIGLMRKDLII